MATIQFIGEFGVELSTAIPYAYYLYCNDKLFKTVSVLGTKNLYFFSKKHKEVNETRKPNDKIPDKIILTDKNKTWRQGTRNYKYWIPPPYKDYFKNTEYKYDFVIYNKYSIEWGHKSCNYIDIETLKTLIMYLKQNYNIIYIRAIGNERNYVNDRQLISTFNDMNEMKKLNITTIQDILNHDKNLDFNELQLKILANCSNFISVQGGPSVISSYFGGTNLILHIKGHELEKGAYAGYFKKFSNANISVVTNKNDLITKCKELF